MHSVRQHPLRGFILTLVDLSDNMRWIFLWYLLKVGVVREIIRVAVRFINTFGDRHRRFRNSCKDLSIIVEVNIGKVQGLLPRVAAEDS
jgi:uncharacterized metal-binding protein